jgi:bifunctional non-homologous end joining protein LigD
MALVVRRRTRAAAVEGEPVIVASLGYIGPCLANPMARPPSGPRWVHLHVHHGRVVAYSRNGHDWTDRYRSVVEEAARLPVRQLILDGETVVRRADGT